MREDQFVKVDKNRVLPLYYQVSEFIEDLIKKGDILPGERMLSEEVLAERFGVSRPTINKAIAILLRKSVLTRERGKGTSVHSGEVRLTFMQELASFHESLQKDKVHFRTVVLAMERQRANKDVAGRLGVKEGSAIHYLKRLRYVQDEALIISESYLPYSMFPDLEKQDFTRHSLYGVLESEYRVPVVKTERSARAVKALDQEALLFRIALGEPLIQLEGVAFSRRDLKVEYFNTKIRGDRGVLSTTLIRSGEHQDGKKRQ
jgi:GntR family transcriptional regulator